MLEGYNLWADLGLEDEWVELCPVCHDQDTQIPPCAWCEGLGYVGHTCIEAGSENF